WGDKGRLRMGEASEPAHFNGHMAQLSPHLETLKGELSFTQNLILPDGRRHPLNAVKFFAGRPSIALVENTFYLLRAAPPDSLLNSWAQRQSLPVSKLSHRLLTKLRKTK